MARQKGEKNKHRLQRRKEKEKKIKEWGAEERAAITLRDE